LPLRDGLNGIEMYMLARESEQGEGGDIDGTRQLKYESQGGSRQQKVFNFQFKEMSQVLSFFPFRFIDHDS